MTPTDRIHSALMFVALGCLAVGASLAWGIGYGLLIIGGLLLAGIVNARMNP